MLKTLNKREQVIIWAAGGAIILVLAFKIIIDPILAKNESLDKQIGITQLKLRKYLQLLSQKESLKDSYAKISSGANIPQEGEDQSTGVLAEIENLAKNSGIHIIDIRPQSQKGLSSYKESFVELRTEGDMESCLKFIYSIENSLSLLEVKKFQFSAKPGTSNLEGNFLISQISLQ